MYCSNVALPAFAEMISCWRIGGGRAVNGQLIAPLTACMQHHEQVSSQERGLIILDYVKDRSIYLKMVDATREQRKREELRNRRAYSRSN